MIIYDDTSLFVISLFVIFLLLVISIDDTSVFVISIADAVTTRVTSSAVLLSIEPSIIVNIVIIVIVTVIVGYDQ